MASLTPSSDEIWAGQHQTGCYTYSADVAQFGTTHFDPYLGTLNFILLQSFLHSLPSFTFMACIYNITDKKDLQGLAISYIFLQ